MLNVVHTFFNILQNCMLSQETVNIMLSGE